MLLSKFQPSTAHAYKYRNRLDMNKAVWNAILRLTLTNVQPAWKNLLKQARGEVRGSWNQDCGAETQNFGLRLQNGLIH